MNSNKPKTIQIDYDLFLQMISYISRHYDLDDPYLQSILDGIQKKYTSMARRELYSVYKSAPSATARENARKEYLSMMGVPESFRWPAEQDLNVSPLRLDATGKDNCLL